MGGWGEGGGVGGADRGGGGWFRRACGLAKALGRLTCSRYFPRTGALT